MPGVQMSASYTRSFLLLMFSTPATSLMDSTHHNDISDKILELLHTTGNCIQSGHFDWFCSSPPQCWCFCKGSTHQLEPRTCHSWNQLDHR